MRSTVSRKTFILVIIFLVVISTVGVVSGYLYGRSSERGESVKQYLLTEDVEPGHSLKGKYREAYVASKTSVNLDKLVLNSNELDGAVASTYLYKNSPLTVTDVTTLENIDRNIEISLPLDLNGSVANSIKAGDIVSIKLTYKDNRKEDAVVISKIQVKDVRSTSGTPVEDNKTLVGYVIFNISNNESSDINNARKEGMLYCAKYNDLTQKPLEKTYKISPDSVLEEKSEKDKASTN